MNCTPTKHTSLLEVPGIVVNWIFTPHSYKADQYQKTIGAVFGPQCWGWTKCLFSVLSGLSFDILSPTSTLFFFSPLRTNEVIRSFLQAEGGAEAKYVISFV